MRWSLCWTVMLLLASIGASSYADTIVITESRDHPLRWGKQDPPAQSQTSFHGTARPGEFFVFQIGVYATQDIGPIEFRSGDLKTGDGKQIAAASIHCINLSGNDFHGMPFTKSLKIPAGALQPLWIGIDVPADASGKYLGQLETAGATISVELDVAGDVAVDHGDAEAQNLSRLRWLDSTVGLEKTVTAPFIPVKQKGRTISILGRSLEIGGDGLPAQLTSFFSASNTRIEKTGRPILAGSISFDVASGKWTPGELQISSDDVAAQWHITNKSSDCSCDVSGKLEFDGAATIDAALSSDHSMEIPDAVLTIPLRRDAAKYVMGLGNRGGLRPKEIHWKWNAKNFQDALWIGDVNAGFQIRFKGSNYRRPLVNIYYQFNPLAVPDSWGGGGVDVTEEGDDHVVLRAHSGPIHLSANQPLHFIFDLYLTPFKPINTDEQWAVRFEHPQHGSAKGPIDQAVENINPDGPNVMNLHHATPYAPFINYPYHPQSFPDLIDLVHRVHDRGGRLKVYYTTREVTNHLPELLALYSLDGEVIFPGPPVQPQTATNPKGPDPWLTEHLVDHFIPAWRANIPAPYNTTDLAVITTPDSRWNNFYLQGLQWLCDKADIDGIYIDDTALDHTSLQRARRILDRRPGRLIDLHSWNHFNSRAGFSNSAGIYLELMPYLDRIWFGEGFSYNDTPPDYWLVEMSGIPYGLMGEMLNKGGNPWLGMLYGMTTRLLWSGDPRPIWKLWDQFDMKNSEMMGYWDPANPVHSDNPNVLATVYRQQNRLLIAVGNFSDKPQTVHLKIDNFAGTGRIPAVEKFQDEAAFSPDDALTIEPKQGRLIWLQNK